MSTDPVKDPEKKADVVSIPRPVAEAATAEPTESSGTPATAENPESDDATLAQELAKRAQALRAQIHRRVVGQERVVDLLLTALFARGHCLLVGVPGLAKTMLIHTLSDGMSLTFNRIQFTPDLMPSDITGTDVLEEDKATGQRHFRFVKGPIFANVILADEINRTPPKTQAALLQAMQEQTVSAGAHTYPLPPPFLVFATQNPIEQEGTYPLPEAQLDRFMFMIDVGYPTQEEEVAIVQATTGGVEAEIEAVLHAEDVLRLQDLVRRVPAPEHVIRYAVSLVRATRPDASDHAMATEALRWGAGPRASQFLILGAKARAVLDGRFVASIDDVKSIAEPVLGHRVVVNFKASSEGIKPADIIHRLVAEVKAEG
jgi:MoxR-like ATPase